MFGRSDANSRWIVNAGILGATAVLLGAFGSHGLRHQVTADRLAVWHVGVEYQMYHALAMLAVALGAQNALQQRWALRLWLTGVTLFSGSLYALVLLGMRNLGFITPIGGICFVAGWISLVWSALRRH